MVSEQPGVSVLIGAAQRFLVGDVFPVHELGSHKPREVHARIPEQVWANARRLRAQARVKTPSNPAPEVRRFAEDRGAARSRPDWATADRLRERIATSGWYIQDTEQGTKLVPVDGGVP